jgi:hypothetical protein
MIGKNIKSSCADLQGLLIFLLTFTKLGAKMLFTFGATDVRLSDIKQT